MNDGANGRARTEETQRAYQQGPILQQKAQIDALIVSIRDEALRYQNGLYGLINSLECSKPAEDKASTTPRTIPQTIGNALEEIRSILTDSNKTLQHTNERIDEQVGELKLLP